MRRVALRVRKVVNIYTFFRRLVGFKFRAMVQEISRQRPTSETWVWSLAISKLVVDKASQYHWERIISKYFGFSPVSIIPLTVLTDLQLNASVIGRGNVWSPETFKTILFGCRRTLDLKILIPFRYMQGNNCSNYATNTRRHPTPCVNPSNQPRGICAPLFYDILSQNLLGGSEENTKG